MIGCYQTVTCLLNISRVTNLGLNVNSPSVFYADFLARCTASFLCLWGVGRACKAEKKKENA